MRGSPLTTPALPLRLRRSGSAFTRAGCSRDALWSHYTRGPAGEQFFVPRIRHFLGGFRRQFRLTRYYSIAFNKQRNTPPTRYRRGISFVTRRKCSEIALNSRSRGRLRAACGPRAPRLRSSVRSGAGHCSRHVERRSPGHLAGRTQKRIYALLYGLPGHSRGSRDVSPRQA